MLLSMDASYHATSKRDLCIGCNGLLSKGQPCRKGPQKKEKSKSAKLSSKGRAQNFGGHASDHGVQCKPFPVAIWGGKQGVALCLSHLLPDHTAGAGGAANTRACQPYHWSHWHIFSCGDGTEYSSPLLPPVLPSPTAACVCMYDCAGIFSRGCVLDGDPIPY